MSDNNGNPAAAVGLAGVITGVVAEATQATVSTLGGKAAGAPVDSFNLGKTRGFAAVAIAMGAYQGYAKDGPWGQRKEFQGQYM